MRSTTNVVTTPRFVCGWETVAACLELSLRQTVHGATDGLEHLEECSANGYANFSVNPRTRHTKTIDNRKAAAHLGDVLGIRSGAGLAAREQVKTPRHGDISLKAFNALAKEGRWVKQDARCARFTSRPEAKVLATFEDETPAALENRFGKGRAVTFAFGLGLIANNLTVPSLYV